MLGIDLPQGVAFLSAVDVATCLRKDVECYCQSARAHSPWGEFKYGQCAVAHWRSFGRCCGASGRFIGGDTKSQIV